MKKFLLIIAVFLGSLTAFSQNPSVPARIGNRTGCTIYVKLMVTDINCNMTLSTTYVVPPYTVIGTLPPPAGWWYDGAWVVDNAAFSIGCFYEKVSVPWALCTPYNVSETGASCCGPVLTASWGLGGTAAAPFLIIHQ